MHTITITATTPPKVSETKSPLPLDNPDPALESPPDIDTSQSTSSSISTCEAPIPVPFDAGLGSICCHLNWQNVCPTCHASRFTESHMVKVTAEHQHPVTGSDGKRVHSVLAQIGQTSLPDVPEVDSNTATPNPCNTQTELPPTFIDPKIAAFLALCQDPLSFVPARPSSPDNLKNSVETSSIQSSQTPAEDETDEGPVGLLSTPPIPHTDLIDLRQDDLSRSESPSTVTNRGLSDSRRPYLPSANPEECVSRPCSSVSSPETMAVVAEAEAHSALANLHPNSILVQQFSSGDSPSCTILIGQESNEEGREHRHSHHHLHHSRSRRRYRSMSSSSSRSRSRSRPRSPRNQPIIIQTPPPQAYPYPYREPYCEHHYPHGPRMAIGPRSPSPSVVHRPPSIISVPSTSCSDAERTRSAPSEREPSLRPVPFDLPPPHELYPREASPVPSIVRVSAPAHNYTNSSHSTIPYYHRLSPSFVHHEKYFYEDGSVVFRIGNILYKVHRHFFDLHSGFFHDLFTALKLTDRYVCDPIVLSDVKTEDFDRLLTLFYPTNYTNSDLTTVEDWTSVLALATKWVFTDIRALAIKHLEPMISSVDKVVFGTKYDVHEWVAPGLKELAMRWRPLDAEEGARLGSAMVVKIGQLRSELGNKFRPEEDILLRVKESLEI